MRIASTKQRQQPRGPQSRYDLAGAHEPPNGRWLPPRNSNAFAAVAVPDPSPDRDGPRTERITATVNRRVDVLELERSAGRISEAAYRVGRLVQAVFERARGLGPSGGWQEGNRVDAAWAHEVAIVRALEDARQVQVYKERIAKSFGPAGVIDARILERVLGDRMGYADVAALQGKGGDRGTWYIANRFRDALEALADAWAARGPEKDQKGDGPT